MLIPRKFSNSKGNNFYTEIKETKRWNKLLREARALQKIQQEDKKNAQKNQKGS